MIPATGFGTFTFGSNGCKFAGNFVNGSVADADLATFEKAKHQSPTLPP